MEMEETKIGRLPHKIEKLQNLGERSPGVEFLRSEVFSGDHGLAVIEHAPFGVIGAVTPVTHSLPTLTGNAVSMIAAGNTLVVNPHPGGKRDRGRRACRRFNEAIYRDLGIDNLICVITEPTIEIGRRDLQASRRQPAVRHRRAGRGPGGHAAGQAGDRGRAGQSARGRRRNGRPGPRRPLHHPRRRLRQQSAVHRRKGGVRRRAGVRRDDGRHGAGRGRAAERRARSRRSTRSAITTVGEGDHKHDVPAKEFIGQDAAVLAAAAGKNGPAPRSSCSSARPTSRTPSCRSSR